MFTVVIVLSGTLVVCWLIQQPLFPVMFPDTRHFWFQPPVTGI